MGLATIGIVDARQSNFDTLRKRVQTKKDRQVVIYDESYLIWIYLVGLSQLDI